LVSFFLLFSLISFHCGGGGGGLRGCRGTIDEDVGVGVDDLVLPLVVRQATTTSSTTMAGEQRMAASTPALLACPCEGREQLLTLAPPALAARFYWS
jgi:hypothetical protein